MSEALSPTYYLGNFQELCSSTQRTYGDLLSANEQAFLEDFAALTEQARCLWVRLLARKGPLFRSDRTRYSEIPNSAAALCELGAEGFVDDAPSATATELLSLALRAEVQRLACELGP